MAEDPSVAAVVVVENIVVAEDVAAATTGGADAGADAAGGGGAAGGGITIAIEEDAGPHNHHRHHRHKHSDHRTVVEHIGETFDHARAHKKEGRVESEKTWTPTFAVTTTMLTKLFARFKNDITTGRKILNSIQFPKPVHVVGMKKVRIPRRKDVIINDLMTVADTEGTIKAEWLDPSTRFDPATPAERVILFAHGGVYILGNRKTHRQITWRLAKHAKARVLSIEYRLAPEHTFPLPLNDFISAYLHLIDPPPGSGSPKYRPDQIFFCGDSAGGNLCLVSTLWMRDDGRWPLPRGLALISPWLDLTHSSSSFILNGGADYLPVNSADPRYIKPGQVHYYVAPHHPLTDPLISPYYATSQHPSRPLPRILIQVGHAERLRDESVSLYAEVLRDEAIQVQVYEGMVHDWHLFATAEGVSRDAIRRITRFVLDSDVASEAGEKFERGIVMVRNRSGYPVEEFGDPIEFLRVERTRAGEAVEAARKVVRRSADAGARKSGDVLPAAVVVVDDEVVAVEAKKVEEIQMRTVDSVEESVKAAAAGGPVVVKEDATITTAVAETVKTESSVLTEVTGTVKAESAVATETTKTETTVVTETIKTETVKVVENEKEVEKIAETSTPMAPAVFTN